jgi:hypothetical protein
VVFVRFVNFVVSPSNRNAGFIRPAADLSRRSVSAGTPDSSGTRGRLESALPPGRNAGFIRPVGSEPESSRRAAEPAELIFFALYAFSGG